MLEKFMVWSNDKIKTLNTEAEAQQFVTKKQLFDSLIIRISEDPKNENVLELSLKEEDDSGELEWKWQADLLYIVGKWAWTTNGYDGETFDTAQKTVKDFVKFMREPEPEEEGSPRYTIWDVYTPAELGIKVSWR